MLDSRNVFVVTDWAFSSGLQRVLGKSDQGLGLAVGVVVVAAARKFAVLWEEADFSEPPAAGRTDVVAAACRAAFAAGIPHAASPGAALAPAADD